MSGAWRSKQVPLHFRVSVRNLLTLRVRVQFREEPLRLTDPEDLTPPESSLATDEDGFCIRSLPIRGAEPTLSSWPGFICYVENRYPRYYIDMGTTFETYASRFSSKTRSTIRRKIRKLESLCGHEIDVRTYCSGDEFREFHGMARALSAKTYQERLLDAGLPDSPEFMSQMVSLAESDRLRAFLLLKQGAPLAYLCCPIRSGNVIFAYLGYDPEYAKASPGTVLQWFALEKLFSEGRYNLFDFTAGDSEHKRFYSTGSIQCGDVFFLRRRLPVLALVATHAAFNRSVELARGLADRWNLRRRVIRLLRAS